MYRHLKNYPSGCSQGVVTSPLSVRYPWKCMVLLTILAGNVILLLTLLFTPIVMSLNIAPTDQELLQLKFASIFCENLTFHSPNKIYLYHVFGEVKIGNQKTLYYWTKTVFLSENNIWTEKFHFLDGSEINVTLNSDFKVKFRVIEDGLEVPASQIRECDQKVTDFCQTINLTIRSSEKVEFLLEGNTSPTFADVRYSFNRTRYDVKDAAESCQGVEICNIQLTFASHSAVVVGNGINAGEITPVRIECQIRLIVVVSSFDGVLLLLFVICVCFSCSYRKINSLVTKQSESAVEGISYGTFADGRDTSLDNLTNQIS